MNNIININDKNTQYLYAIHNLFDISEKIIKEWLMLISKQSYVTLFNEKNKNLIKKPIIIKSQNTYEAFYLDIVDNDYEIKIDENIYLNMLSVFECSIRVVYESIYKTMNNKYFENIFLLTNTDKNIFYPYKFSYEEKLKLYLEMQLKKNQYNDDIVKQLDNLNLKLNENKYKNLFINNNKPWKNLKKIGIKKYIFESTSDNSLKLELNKLNKVLKNSYNIF